VPIDVRPRGRDRAAHADCAHERKGHAHLLGKSITTLSRRTPPPLHPSGDTFENRSPRTSPKRAKPPSPHWGQRPPRPHWPNSPVLSVTGEHADRQGERVVSRAVPRLRGADHVSQPGPRRVSSPRLRLARRMVTASVVLVAL